MALRLGTIIEQLGGELHGDPALEIQSLAPLESAGPQALSFLSNPKYRQQLAVSRAGCVIVGPQMLDEARARGACIVADNPYLYFARVTQLWQRARQRPSGPRIHPSAVVDPEALVDPTAQIGPLCVVERGARIGAHTVLKSRVTVSEDCVIGARCVLHPGVVIGADGFGFAKDGERWEKIEQLGAVRIGNDVDIGANTCIDRGALADTVIEDGVKLDNLIQIGHNVPVAAVEACASVAADAAAGLGAAAVLAGAAASSALAVRGVRAGVAAEAGFSTGAAAASCGSGLFWSSQAVLDAPWICGKCNGAGRRAASTALSCWSLWMVMISGNTASVLSSGFSDC